MVQAALRYVLIIRVCRVRSRGEEPRTDRAQRGIIRHRLPVR